MTEPVPQPGVERRSLLRAAAVCAGATACRPVSAQGVAAYPTRPVRIVAPFPPAGAADVISRMLAEQIAPVLGQPVVVENRPGAGGSVGTEVAVRAPADGHTLLMGSQATNSINPELHGNLRFDPARDLVPVAPVGAVASVLYVREGLPVRSVAELLARAKAEPGRLTYGSAGNGGASHLAMALLEHLAGVRLTHVPYRGTAPATADVLAGSIDMLFDTLPTALPHVQAGRVRALAVSTPRRHPLLPHLPTVAEAGVPGYEAVSYYGIFLPAGTPDAVLDALGGAIGTALARPEFQAKLSGGGVDPLPGTAAEFAAFVAQDRARWGEVIRAANIRPD